MTRPARLRSQIAAFTLTRTALNTGWRMVYPFLPTLARSVGVSLETMALAVTARSALSAISPVMGAVSDARGRKVTMLAGLAMFSGGLLLVLVWPTYWALFAALLLAGLGKITFDPAEQAYLGDRVAYEQRGLAIALTEIGWSTAYLFGVPVAAWLIARAGWRAPFPFLAGLAALAAVVLWRLLPDDAPAQADRPSFSNGVRTVLAHPVALAGLAVGLLASSGNEVVNIVFGAWMENAFGLQIAALGAASAVIGVAELGGEGLVAGFADRLGKRRAVGIGLALNAAACLLLPLIGHTLVGALIGLFLLYLTFEFMLVSSLPLMTELVPGARATLMAGNYTALGAGRMLGALAGPLLFRAGMLANGAAAMLVDMAALVVLLLWVRVDSEK